MQQSRDLGATLHAHYYQVGENDLVETRARQHGPREAIQSEAKNSLWGEEDQMREYERYQFIARGPAADRTLILAGHNVAVPRRMHVARFCTV